MPLRTVGTFAPLCSSETGLESTDAPSPVEPSSGADSVPLTSSPTLHTGVIPEYPQLSADTLGKKQLVMGIHLYVDWSSHGGLSKDYVKVHSATQLERSLIVRSGHLVSLHEVALPKSCKCSDLLEQGTTNDCDISATINQSIGRDTLNLYFDTLGNASLVCDTYTLRLDRWVLIRR